MASKIEQTAEHKFSSFLQDPASYRADAQKQERYIFQY